MRHLYPTRGRDAEREQWEVKTIARHTLSLCSEEPAEICWRGEDQPWMDESTFPLCSAVVVLVEREKGPRLCGQGIGLLEKEEGFLRGCWKEADVGVTQCLFVEKSGRLQGSTAKISEQ